MENLIAELITQVFLANSRKKHTIFFDFSGHVNTISVSALKGKWKPKAKSVFESNVRLNVPGAKEQLSLLIEYIKSL